MTTSTVGQRGELRLVQGILSSLVTSAGDGGDGGAGSVDLSQVTVLDCGGGTGRMAVPIAQLGAQVTVVDPSADALAALASRAAGAGVGGRVNAIQGDIEELDAAVGATQFDLALVHGVLDAVDPRAALTAVQAQLRPGGLASILINNPAAVVLAKVLAGDLDAAVSDLRGAAGDLDAATLAGVCDEIGFVVERVIGVGVFADLIPAGASDPGHVSAAAELETLGSEQSPYREIAARLHVLARRPPAPEH